MTGVKDVFLDVDITTVRCSLCGHVLAVISPTPKTTMVDFIGHLRRHHPECLNAPSSSAIQDAIRNSTSVERQIKKAEEDKGKRLVHPYLPPE